MTSSDYLLSYGSLGDFGRFFPVTPLTYHRGQRAVVQSPRGVEMATILGTATPGHARFLPNTTVGQILRLATSADEELHRHHQDTGRRLFEEARRRAQDDCLPLEIVDVEFLLDGEHAVLHLLRWADFDPRPLVSGLSRTFEVHILLQDLTRTGCVEAEPEEEEAHGCGKPGCGSEGGGGCSSTGGECGTGGGCSTCGLKNAVDMKAYFARLREEMEKPVPRQNL